MARPAKPMFPSNGPVPPLTPVNPAPRDMTPDDLASEGGLTQQQAAEFLSLSLRTVKLMVQKGILPSVRSGRRRIVFKRGCVGYLAQLRREQS